MPLGDIKIMWFWKFRNTKIYPVLGHITTTPPMKMDRRITLETNESDSNEINKSKLRD